MEKCQKLALAAALFVHDFDVDRAFNELAEPGLTAVTAIIPKIVNGNLVGFKSSC
jgi:hypothetical protein